MAAETRGSPDASGFERYFHAWLAAVLAFAGAVYFYIAAADPIFERAETFFTECAREMFAMHRYITPFMYGRPFIDKPILSYWGMEASYALFGVSHFTSRIPSVVAALATAGLTGWATARVWGRLTGLMAALLLCGSVGFFYFATLAMSDIWLTCCCTGALVWLFAGSCNERRRTFYWAVAATWCALAVLAKGPIGAFFPVAAALGYLALRRELSQIRLRHVLIGAAIIVAIAGGWFVLLWEQTGSGLVKQFLFQENLQRFAGATYQINIGKPLWFIPLNLLLYFLPYSLLLIFAAGTFRKRCKDDWESEQSRGELFLWCYVTVTVGFFTVARSVNDYYVLPAMPACAVLAAVYFTRAVQTERGSRPIALTSWMIVALLTLSCGAAAGIALFSPQSGLKIVLPLLVWIFAAGLAMCLLLARRRYLALPAAVLVMLGGASVFTLPEIIPPYLRAFPLAQVAAAVASDREGLPLGSAPLAISGDLEHWRRELAFQTTRVPEELDTREAMEEFLNAPGPRLILVTDSALNELPAAEKAELRTVYQVSILMQGAKLDDFLRPEVLGSKMKRIAWIYSDRTGTAPK